MVGNIGRCTEENTEDLVPDWSPVGRGLLCVTGDNSRAYELLKIFQTAAVLEIVHAMIGIVRSGVMTTLQQVFSRVMLVWAVVFVMPSLTATAAFTNMCLAWCITEVSVTGTHGAVPPLENVNPCPTPSPRHSTLCCGALSSRQVAMINLPPRGAVSRLCATAGTP